MKVIMINGSRREKGCTYTALMEVAGTLNKESVETEMFHIGLSAVKGGINDIVQEVGGRLKTADGIVVGSPVYYASPSGEVMVFLDRLFSQYSRDIAFKPGACVVSARRAGTTASLDVLNKYFMINQMPVVSSGYWNMVHGNTPDEVREDLEGMQIMRMLGRNMAWLLKCIRAGKDAHVQLPEQETHLQTNFIRSGVR